VSSAGLPELPFPPKAGSGIQEWRGSASRSFRNKPIFSSSDSLGKS